MDGPWLYLPRSLHCYSSSGCSMLFYLCFGTAGEAALIPLAQSDGFHIMEVQDVCKTLKLLTHPQTPPWDGGNDSTSRNHTLHPRRAHLSKPEQTMQQCTNPLPPIFYKIISSFLQTHAPEHCCQGQTEGRGKSRGRGIAGTPASGRPSAVQPGRAEREISDS